MKTLKKQIEEMGYKPGTDEFRKAYSRLCWHRRSKESKYRCGRQGHAYVKKRMERDPAYAERQRAIWRRRKNKQRLNRGEEYNAKQRKWYKENREKALESVKRSRRRRNPTIGFAALLRGIKRGDREPAELLEHARTAIDKLNSLGSRGRRSRLSKIGDTGPKDSKAERTKPGERPDSGQSTSRNDKTGGSGSRC